MADEVSTPAAAVGGLRKIFGIGSGGGVASWEYVGQRLRELYINNPEEKARRENARKRDELYAGGGAKYTEELIDAAFSAELNKDLRTKLLAWSGWNNVVKRIVHEKATVYSEPPARHIANNDEAYQRFLEVVKMDAMMRALNRRLALHEDMYVQYRVRQTPRGRTPVVDLISPACFWAVHHPRDKTLLVAIIIDQLPDAAAAGTSTEACYRVWTDDESFALDGRGEVIETSVESWPLGRMPGILATLEPPTARGSLLAQNPSDDLCSASVAVRFLSVTLLKETKSKSKQNYLSGDVSHATMGQTSDSETDVILPEGVQVQSVDRGMDLDPIRQTATQIFDETAANHGIPPSVAHHRDATSGFEVHLRRLPLRELRNEQIPVMRDVERELFAIQVGVNAMKNALDELELPEAQFDPTGWSLDYGEVQQPMTTAEANTNFETERRLGLTDTPEEKLRRNPDLKTIDAAEKQLEVHTARETKRVANTQTLQALNGSSNSAVGDKSPEQNGRDGAAAAASSSSSSQRP